MPQAGSCSTSTQRPWQQSERPEAAPSRSICKPHFSHRYFFMAATRPPLRNRFVAIHSRKRIIKGHHSATGMPGPGCIHRFKAKISGNICKAWGGATKSRRTVAIVPPAPSRGQASCSGWSSDALGFQERGIFLVDLIPFYSHVRPFRQRSALTTAAPLP